MLLRDLWCAFCLAGARILWKVKFLETKLSSKTAMTKDYETDF